MTHRVALIGPGRWGRNILRALSSLAEVPHIVHGGRTETEAFLREHYPSATISSDYTTMLRDATIDAVCIATPIPTHADIVRAALHAGKHVFVEKPLSLDAAEIDELYDSAAAKNLVLFTGYVYRFDPAFCELTRLCESETKLSASFTWKKYGTFDSPLTENLLVHEVALAYDLLGSGTLSVIKMAENFFSGTYEGERGRATITIDRESNETAKTISVTTASASYHHAIGTLEQVSGGARKLLIEDTAPILTTELATFLKRITHGAAENEKGRQIDLAVAVALASIR